MSNTPDLATFTSSGDAERHSDIFSDHSQVLRPSRFVHVALRKFQDFSWLMFPVSTQDSAFQQGCHVEFLTLLMLRTGR